jgi:hypothetical protein
MEILRVPSYSSIVSIDVSEPGFEYDYEIEDMADLSVTSGSATSDSNSKISIELPYEYDGLYRVSVDNEENIFEIVRPYVDPNTKGTTASEIAEYARHEELARAIIDSIVTQGFYYRKGVIQTSGVGTDYLPVWHDAKKVLKVYENNVLIYDNENASLYSRNFEITKDKTAIIESAVGSVNRSEGASLLIPIASSDQDVIEYYSRGFARTADYIVVVEEGYKKIPGDIVRATELLVEDISCGKLEYYKRYVQDYNTDQFKLRFNDAAFEGTGNIIVDKILSKYLKTIQTLGVL